MGKVVFSVKRNMKATGQWGATGQALVEDMTRNKQNIYRQLIKYGVSLFLFLYVWNKCGRLNTEVLHVSS